LVHDPAYADVKVSRKERRLERQQQQQHQTAEDAGQATVRRGAWDLARFAGEEVDAGISMDDLSDVGEDGLKTAYDKTLRGAKRGRATPRDTTGDSSEEDDAAAAERFRLVRNANS
jgi:hypothetical protein